MDAGPLLLWLLWRKGYVVQSVRQPSTEDDGQPTTAATDPPPVRT